VTRLKAQEGCLMELKENKRLGLLQRMHLLQQATHTIFIEDVLQGDSRMNQVLPDPCR